MARTAAGPLLSRRAHDAAATLRRAAGLPRLSALRQAMGLTALFLLVLIAAGALALWEVRDALDRRADDRLRARFAEVSAEVAAGTFDAVDHPASGYEDVRLLTDPGDALYGREGVFFASGRSAEGRGRDPWLWAGGAVPGGWLLVGQNTGEIAVFDAVLVQTLLGIGAAALIAALAAGLWLGWRSQARLGAISRVLSRAAEGDLSARVAPARDRDDLDRLGAQVDAAIARIEAALEQARGFSANIAHDLRTPLQRLRLHLETAVTGEGDPAEEAGAALEETDRAIAIFDAFLRLSRLESGALERRFEPVDLAALARETAETYAPVIEDGGRQLETAIATGAVQGDPVLLGQALSNLISNAIRHTPPGTTLRLLAGPGLLGLEDDGPGIPEAERGRVTEPLYRLDRSRGTEGAGLGLALVRTIAARHGARLVLGEAPGGGLSVRLEWPRPDRRRA